MPEGAINLTINLNKLDALDGLRTAAANVRDQHIGFAAVISANMQAVSLRLIACQFATEMQRAVIAGHIRDPNPVKIAVSLTEVNATFNQF